MHIKITLFKNKLVIITIKIYVECINFLLTNNCQTGIVIGVRQKQNKVLHDKNKYFQGKFFPAHHGQSVPILEIRIFEKYIFKNPEKG